MEFWIILLRHDLPLPLKFQAQFVYFSSHTQAKNEYWNLVPDSEQTDAS